jgi:hypothetical protein
MKINFKSYYKNILIVLCFLTAIATLNAQDYNSIEGAITIQHQEGWDSGSEAYTTTGVIYGLPASTFLIK